MSASPYDKDPTAASEQILRSAAELMRTGGIAALSTRAVAAAAGVKPPIIYRQFGDKQRLLDATTHFVFDRYIAEKRRVIAQSADPLRDLERLWDLHVDFGLSNPHCYTVAYVRTAAGTPSAWAAQALALLRQVVARLGSQGRLRVSVERAAGLIRSTTMGVVLVLIPLPAHDRDLRISRILRDSTLSAIIHDESELRAGAENLSARAVALREELYDPCESTLTPAERKLLDEWLIRLANKT